LEVRDITKPTLKDMVFNPPFAKELKIKSQFTYKVNNSGTFKTIKFLSTRYFGSEKYWKKISKINPRLGTNPDKTLPDGTVILIPNY